MLSTRRQRPIAEWRQNGQSPVTIENNFNVPFVAAMALREKQAGRGFSVRREDMKKLLIATRGKVFTLQNLQALTEHTGLREFSSC